MVVPDTLVRHLTPAPEWPHVHIQVARTIHCISTNLAEIQLGKSQRIDFLPCGCAVWSGIQRLSHIVCTAPTFPQNGSHVHVQVAQTRYCKATKVAFLKVQRYNFRLQLIFIMWLYSRTKWQVLKSRNVNIAQKNWHRSQSQGI